MFKMSYIQSGYCLINEQGINCARQSLSVSEAALCKLGDFTQVSQ